MGSLTVPTTLPGKRIVAGAGGLKGLIFGDPGSGKTHVLKSFALDPRSSPLLLLDPTGGTVGVAADVEAAGSQIWACTDANSVLAYGEWLMANKGVFKTLAIDDFSEVFGLTKTGVIRAKAGPTALEMEGSDYDVLYENTRRVFRMLKILSTPLADGGAGMHVVATAWADKKQNRNKEDKVVPALAGKFSFEAPGYFDLVGYLEGRSVTVRNGKETTKEFQTKLTCEPDGTLVVKDRLTRITTLYGVTGTAILDALLGADTTHTTINGDKT